MYISDAMETGSVQVGLLLGENMSDFLLAPRPLSFPGLRRQRTRRLTCPCPCCCCIVALQVNSAPARGPDHFPFQGFRDSGIGSQGVASSLEFMCKVKVGAACTACTACLGCMLLPGLPGQGLRGVPAHLGAYARLGLACWLGMGRRVLPFQVSCYERPGALEEPLRCRQRWATPPHTMAPHKPSLPACLPSLPPLPPEQTTVINLDKPSYTLG
jgi:hypothetical protein